MPIVHSPESPMPEPYRGWVAQRFDGIRTTLEEFIDHETTPVQICPRPILPEEIVFRRLRQAIVYGAVVAEHADGRKSVLYDRGLAGASTGGVVARSETDVANYVDKQSRVGNRVRIKDPEECDGQGQHVVETAEQALEIASRFSELSEVGLVLMPNLEIILDRFSIGRIALGFHGTYRYIGREKVTTYKGKEAYGGCEIALFHANDFNTSDRMSRELEVPSAIRRLGDKAVGAFMEEVALSYQFSKSGRASVDILKGVTANGSTIVELGDLTARAGGTTPAETLAIREVRNRPGYVAHASGELIYHPTARPRSGKIFIDSPELTAIAQVNRIERPAV